MYSCCRTSVSSWLQEGMTKPLQCTRNIRTGGFTYLKASRWKTSRYIYKRHFGDVSSSKSMEPLSHKGSLFLATLHSGVGCRQEISTGDRTACLSSLSQKVFSALFTAQINFPYNHCKENYKRFKGIWLFIFSFLDLHLGYQKTLNAVSQTSRRCFHSPSKKYSWILG